MNTTFTSEEDKSYTLRINSSIYAIDANDMYVPIGRGAFGIVYKGYIKSKYNQSPEYVAIKQINKLNSTAEKFQSEIKIMKDLNSSKNVVKLFDFGEDELHYYIVMEYFDQNNLTIIINQQKIPTEQDAIELLRQICYGVIKMQQKGLIHRDLKTDNILVQTSKDSRYPYLLAIADFGSSRNSSSNMTTCIGTDATRAPEVNTGFYNEEADIYSLGCILYKMITNKEPFEIITAKTDTKLNIGKCYSLLTMNLLEGCLQYDKDLRMSPKELMNALQIDSLYTNYKPLSLNEVDSDPYIYLKERKRKLYQQRTQFDKEKDDIHKMYKQQIQQLTDELLHLKQENEAYRHKVDHINNLSLEENVVKLWKKCDLLAKIKDDMLDKLSSLYKSIKSDYNKTPFLDKKSKTYMKINDNQKQVFPKDQWELATTMVNEIVTMYFQKFTEMFTHIKALYTKLPFGHCNPTMQAKLVSQNLSQAEGWELIKMALNEISNAALAPKNHY